MDAVATKGGGETGFHGESRDKRLNRYLLDGFRRHLVEVKDTLGEPPRTVRVGPRWQA